MILSFALLVCAAEPSPLQLGVESGYSRTFGSRSNNGPDSIIDGARLSIDGRYRIIGPISLGMYGHLLHARIHSGPSGQVYPEQIRTIAGGGAGAYVYGAGVLASVAHSFRFVEIGIDAGVGYQLLSIGRFTEHGPTFQLTVTALARVSSLFALGLYVQALATKNEGSPGAEPLFYAWLSGGLRATLHLF